MVESKTREVENVPLLTDPNIVFSSGNHTYRPEWKAGACPGKTGQDCAGHQWVKATSLKELEFHGLRRLRAHDHCQG